MTDITQRQRELVNRVLGGGGKAPAELRRAAFDNAGLSGPVRTLIQKVALHAYDVTDDDIAAVRTQQASSEDQIFEIVICAAVGQANRQYESGLAALAFATKEEVGDETRNPGPGSPSEHEGAAGSDPAGVATAGGRRREAGAVSTRLLRRR